MLAAPVIAHNKILPISQHQYIGARCLIAPMYWCIIKRSKLLLTPSRLLGWHAVLIQLERKYVFSKMAPKIKNKITPSQYETRVRICTRFWSPGIDSTSLCSWRDGTKNMVVVPAHQAGNRFLVTLKGLQIRAQYYPTKAKFPPPPPHHSHWSLPLINAATSYRDLARICKPYKEPRNWFPALQNWFLGIDSWAPKIQALDRGIELIYFAKNE